RSPALSLQDRQRSQPAGDRRAGRSMRRDLSSGGGGGRQANRRKSRAHHRDKCSWNRSRALFGQQEEEKSSGRLNLGSLRAEHRDSVSGGRQSGHGRDDE